MGISVLAEWPNPDAEGEVKFWGDGQSPVLDYPTVFLMSETQKCQSHQNPEKSEKLSQ
jgi:hypothetical protein